MKHKSEAYKSSKFNLFLDLWTGECTLLPCQWKEATTNLPSPVNNKLVTFCELWTTYTVYFLTWSYNVKRDLWGSFSFKKIKARENCRHIISFLWWQIRSEYVIYMHQEHRFKLTSIFFITKKYHELLKLIVIDIHQSISVFTELTIKSSKRFHMINQFFFIDSNHTPSLLLYNAIS